MKITSTNIAEPKTIIWNDKEVATGIYKKPIEQPIYLTRDDVATDTISDRHNHGGFYKACYIFAEEQYPHWEERYPDLDWGWGMFGENLTVSGLDEREIYVGAIYQIGEAVVQVSQNREPCFKLGHKFGSVLMIGDFIRHGRVGTYLSVLEEGHVSKGNEFILQEIPKDKITSYDLFQLLFGKEKNQDHLKIAIESRAIPKNKRVQLSRFLK